jgi:hypothetical protein
VQWDGETTKKTIKEDNSKNFELIMSARFILIPVKKLKDWLLEFDNLNILITESSGDKKAKIRKLRIEANYNSSVFEKIWQAEDKNHQILNQKWDNVWLLMSEALSIEPVFSNFNEDFWLFNPIFRYNFQNYQPDKLLSLLHNLG